MRSGLSEGVFVNLGVYLNLVIPGAEILGPRPFLVTVRDSHGGPAQESVHPVSYSYRTCARASSTMCSAMAREAVAPGEGALRT